MRRYNTIRRLPQRIVLGQGFRIRDVERRAAEAAAAVAAGEGVVVVVGVQGGDEVALDDDLAAGDVGEEGVFLAAEDGELGRADEVGCLGCEGHADEEVVDVLGEEVVQGSLVQAREPGFGDGAVRVAGSREDEARVVFGGRGRARGGRVGDDGHAHAAGDAGDLAADAAVAEDAEALAGFVSEALQRLFEGGGAPFVVLLPGVEEGVAVGVGEHGQDDPFGDLGAVDARGCSQGDRGVFVDGRVGDVVGAGGEEVDELEVGAVGWGRRDGGEGNEDGCIFEDFCSGRSGQYLCNQIVKIERNKGQGCQSNLWVCLNRYPTPHR